MTRLGPVPRRPDGPLSWSGEAHEAASRRRFSWRVSPAASELPSAAPATLAAAATAWSSVARLWVSVLAAALLLPAAVQAQTGAAPSGASLPPLEVSLPPLEVGLPPLEVIVLDPLSAPLCCACVEGQGQRRYDLFLKEVERRLGRAIHLTFNESLTLGLQRIEKPADFVIGPCSVVAYDARKSKVTVRRLSLLTDRQGSTLVRGQFLVKGDSPIATLSDLAGKTVCLGPEEYDEANLAPRQRLPDRGAGARLQSKGSLEEAVYAVTDGDAAAAAAPSYLLPLLRACGKVLPDSLRVLEETGPVEFIGCFATDRVDDVLAARWDAALRGARTPKLLEQMESAAGFVTPQDEWLDWRGAERRGLSDRLPLRLPEEPLALWRQPTTGAALAGLSATHQYVLVADKDAEFREDIFRCLDAHSGKEKWTLRYAAEGRMDYTNAPRATPLIHRGLAYLQGVWGDLHCVELDTGRVVWRIDFRKLFEAEPPTWGFSVPPLIAEGKLIVAPGAKRASVAALDPQTGAVLWQTPGHAAAYAPFLYGVFGGRPQLLGYDSAGLGGWDLDNGRPLWHMTPPGQSDFHVATPVPIGAAADRLLLATENNATRMYAFDGAGRVPVKPSHVNNDLAPDTCTPIVLGDRIYGAAYGELYCLRLKDLSVLWRRQDDKFFDHVNLIGGNGRVLLWTTTCDLLLIKDQPTGYELVSHLRPFAEEEKAESMSHPALVGSKLYLRSNREVLCLELADLLASAPKRQP